jgi:hypothetical protein
MPGLSLPDKINVDPLNKKGYGILAKPDPIRQIGKNCQVSQCPPFL